MKLAAAFLIGSIFGVGILISGMANPAKVLNFFDVAGAWDPSLLLVTAAALITTMVGYRMVFATPAPRFSDRFHTPQATRIDAPLVLGSAAFGVGWGIAGFCPGGAIPALAIGRVEPVLFVAAMAAGMFAAKAIRPAALGGVVTSSS